MTNHLPSSTDRSRRPRWWRALRIWERVALVVVLLGTLVLSAALIYFRPSGALITTPNAPSSSAAATAGPEFPPGTRWYYQRGQWVPQDQQSPVQP